MVWFAQFSSNVWEVEGETRGLLAGFETVRKEYGILAADTLTLVRLLNYGSGSPYTAWCYVKRLTKRFKKRIIQYEFEQKPRKNSIFTLKLLGVDIQSLIRDSSLKFWTSVISFWRKFKRWKAALTANTSMGENFFCHHLLGMLFGKNGVFSLSRWSAKNLRDKTSLWMSLKTFGLHVDESMSVIVKS